MKHAQVKEAPDVPEIHQAMAECKSKMHEALFPVIMANQPNVSINCLTAVLMETATLMAETSEDFDEVIEALCQTIKLNAPSVKKRALKKAE